LKGLPKNGKKREWITFRKQWNELFRDLMFDMNEWCVSKGAPKLPENKLHPHSPHLNIYVYPKELDYGVLDLSHTKWVQIDCLINKTNQKFSIPKELMEKPGKLIYLSMGEFADSDLMKRLISILANSRNKFIVSKSPFHDKYELPDNMLGFQVLPQTNVIPIVDLVITCGDNKTIIEAFYFCKPVIVMPLFGDHLDNAQRIKENGFGLNINPYTCNKETLLCGINAMLDDKLLFRRLSPISHRMQNSNNEKHLSNLIESVIKA
jgi:UDP:flavonoid glycosyltransferase YjiC (YdhE family)